MGGPRADTHGSQSCCLFSTVGISMHHPGACILWADAPLGPFWILPMFAQCGHMNQRCCVWNSAQNPVWLTVVRRAAGKVAREMKLVQVTCWWAFKSCHHKNSALEKERKPRNFDTECSVL